MTTVTYYETNDEISIEIKGHCGYGVEGSDIVCSAISMLAQTLLAYLNIDNEDMKYCMKSGYVWAYAKGDNVVQTFHVIMCGYHLLAENYPDHVKVVRGCSIQKNGA